MNVRRKPLGRSSILRILTYNVHSCIGLDGRLSLRRIARVIAQLDADVVALQELDQHRPRTGGADQAHSLTRLLQMKHHFHPSFSVASGSVGNAVLSRLPMRRVKAGPLPSLLHRRQPEPRSVLWVVVEVGDRLLQVLNTHFGLRQSERLAQARALLGPDWYQHPDCQSPAVICGDFNALPGSPPYLQLESRLHDAQRAREGWQPLATWPARWPVSRIDHVFASAEVNVRRADVPCGGLARVASDHRPVLVDIELC